MTSENADVALTEDRASEPFAHVPVTLVTIGSAPINQLEPGTYFAIPPAEPTESIQLHGPYPDTRAALDAAAEHILTAAQEEAAKITSQEDQP